MKQHSGLVEERVRWIDLERQFRDQVVTNLRSWVEPENPHYEQTLTFALGRLEEGRQLARFFEERFPQSPVLQVLDLGAGNGGVSLGMANLPNFAVTSLDLIPNNDLRELRSGTKVPIRQLVGNGHHLPLRSHSMDIVLCLETIEHVPRPRLLAQEIMRVLKPGGQCMITTPARAKFLIQPDPHYGIRYLLLLPGFLQKYVATAVLKRTDHWDVEHIFWHTRGVTRHFKPFKQVETVWNHPYSGLTRAHNLFWRAFCGFLWDRIIIQK